MASLRHIWRIAMLLAGLATCLIPHLLWRLLRQTSPWPHIFLKIATYSVGARVIIKGTPLRHDVFFVSNHVSWIDILALGGATGTAFISHDGVASWPLVGWLARQNNTVFVARTNRRGVRDQINNLQEALSRRQPVALFPEGTTSDGTGLLPFKPALLAGLMPPPRDLEIQPVWIDYGPDPDRVAWFGEEPAGANVARILKRKHPLTVTLHFLEPFDPEDYVDRKAVAQEARKRILERQTAFVNPRASV